MALDRWIALAFLLICAVYGYAAFFTMDASMPPFMRRTPGWPSSFPKLLAVLGIGTALALLVLPVKRKDNAPDSGEIQLSRILEYNWGQALALVGLMVVYALLLRTLGFVAATALFLLLGGAILGERNWVLLGLTAAVATGVVWYLVQEVLGIFLRPWPWFIVI
jgi:putative tricarboxylic transport membrane protein